MNINSLFDSIPQRDAFFNIFIENHNVEQVLPEFEPCSEHCICIQRPLEICAAYKKVYDIIDHYESISR